MKTAITRALPTHRTAAERDPRWRAVLARDASADGRFYYSVRSTGVYCRPSCPSRHARPENVQFHASCAAAERAGFRPCRRCRPQGPSPAAARAAVVARICRELDAATELPRLATLARSAGMSVHHFHRVFKAATGLSPRAYAMAQRARRMRSELRSSTSVTRAIYDAGYNSGARFYEAAGDVLGMTPGEFRAGAAAADIQYACARCTLGTLLAARSGRGLCAVLLGDGRAALLRDLQERFPKARIRPGGRDFATWVAQVVRLVETPAVGLDLPLDVRGTAFQQRVWQALRRIPAGSTASYADIARRIGAPAAARAVAQACAANALAVAIPCHRVVRSDGGLSGYRWGLERKRSLLEREAVRPEKK